VIAQRVLRRLFGIYGGLPKWARVFIVRRSGPLYAVGATCVLRREDGAVLLLRNSYREGWGLPGGLLRRNEEVLDAVKREVREEVGIDVEIDSEPRVVVDARNKRIDVVFTGHPPRDAAELGFRTSAEIEEVQWFAPDKLPVMQKEAARILALVGVRLTTS
jgi:8-oxo-dGTP diphosphatase